MSSERRSFLGHLAIFGLFAALAIGWAVFILYKGGGLPKLGTEPYTLRAAVPTSASLVPGARVTMAGVHVGEVTEVEREGIGARIELELTDDAVTPVPADTRFTLRQRTPVGENYVSLEPGRSARKLRSGALLPAEQAAEYVDFDQILSTLDGRTRERTRTLLRSVGGALSGRGDELNATLRGGAQLLRHGGRLVRVTFRDRRALARLVDQLGRVSAAIGERGVAIDALADRGLTAMTALRNRDAALAALLREAPPLLRQARTTGGTLGSFSNRATPVVDDLAGAARDLRPAFQSMRPAANEGRAVMAELGAAAPGLRGTLRQLTRLSGPLPAALPQLHKAVCQANPALRYVQPYTRDLIGIVSGLGSAANTYDATGHLIRLTASLGMQHSPIGLPENVNETIDGLFRSGVLARSMTNGFDPYMKPNLAGITRARPGAPQSPKELRERGFEYPRITADC